MTDWTPERHAEILKAIDDMRIERDKLVEAGEIEVDGAISRYFFDAVDDVIALRGAIKQEERT